MAQNSIKRPWLIPWYIVKAARPLHWIKNLSLFAPLIFTGNLYNVPLFGAALWAFSSFCFATSATYIFNDILDAPLDRIHPIKKNRPIASGKLPVPVAVFACAAFALIAYLLANRLNPILAITVVSYLILQIIYSLGAKNFAILDILIIAAGFVIRIYSGAFVINAHLSVWFLLCVISVALFLAAGKRRAELGVLTASGSSTTRKSLTNYTKPLLDSYVTMFGNAAWMSWALFTFFESPKATLPIWLFLAEISRTTAINKLLMITIPVVIFIIMRYQRVIFEDRSEAPEKVLLTDIPLISAIGIWGLMVIWILYGGVSSLI
jgi:4-hydroxybenzoate polyprenyltransferase